MKTFRKLKISCTTNPDINGDYNKNDIEQEMAEIGMPVEDANSWIAFVLVHFDFPDIIDDAICYDDVYSIVFKQDGHVVHVTKI